jgi:hypothetical protein
MAVPISFRDYRMAQSAVTVSGVNMIKSAVQKSRYGWVYAARAKGGMLHKYSGGDVLQEKVSLDAATTFASYVPDDVAATAAQQHMAMPTTYIVYGRDYIRWTKQEAVHNGQSGDFSDEARSMKYFNFNKSLDVRQQVSTANGMEADWAAVPNPTTMDFLGCTKPNSLFHLVNEFPNSLYVNAGSAFTTKHGINPGTYPSFRNHIFGYNSTAASPAANAKNIINALDTANERMPYSPPTGMGFDRSPDNWFSEGWGSKVGLTSHTGVEIVKDLLRQRNQTWTMTNEMGMARPVYNGVELVGLPSLQTAAVYPSTADATVALGYSTNTTAVTEGASTAYGLGPRIYLLDTNAYGMYVNSEGNFNRGDVIQYENQPGSFAQFVDVWYQYFNPMPWLCGVVAPGTVTGVFPSITYVADDIYTQY